MTDIGTEVNAGIAAAETDAGVILNDAGSVTTVLQDEIAKGKTALDALKTHSAASQPGNLISDTIANFTVFIKNIEVALGFAPNPAASTPAPAPAAPVTPAEPAPAPEAPAEPAAAEESHS